jgi:hypothetical protein
MTPDHTIPRCPGPRVCGLARETLAVSELELRERLESVEQDCATYRAIALETLAALHHVTRDRDALRRRCHGQQEQLHVLLGLGPLTEDAAA